MAHQILHYAHQKEMDLMQTRNHGNNQIAIGS